MKLVHHGGHRGVTGSCHQLHWGAKNKHSLLVDCGLFQGEDAEAHPDLEIEFSLEGVVGLLLTHVHIDHVGRLPYLLAAGFKGPIYCSPPSAKLLPLVIEDALKIGFTRNKRMINAFLNRVADHLRPLPYGQWEDLPGDAQMRLQPAGHILGSAYAELEVEKRRVVFSGDLGAPYAPLLNTPKSPAKADWLILESTYGDKLHQGRAERRQTLETVIRRTLDNQGTTIVPAFSLGRTQELLYELNDIFERIQKKRGSSLLKYVDVIVDSPMAARYTELYSEMDEFWDIEARKRLASGDQPLVFDNLLTVGEHDEHRRTLDYLRRSGRPAIVLSGSGMCTGGRVMNYLKALLSDEKADVLFVGYQGRGTPGRAIQAGEKEVKLDGKMIDVKAGVHTISGYSAHADQQNLLDFVKRIKSPPEKIVLVHGERGPKAALKKKLKEMEYTVQ